MWFFLKKYNIFFKFANLIDLNLSANTTLKFILWHVTKKAYILHPPILSDSTHAHILFSRCFMEGLSDPNWRTMINTSTHYIIHKSVQILLYILFNNNKNNQKNGTVCLHSESEPNEKKWHIIPAHQVLAVDKYTKHRATNGAWEHHFSYLINE